MASRGERRNTLPVSNRRAPLLPVAVSVFGLNTAYLAATASASFDFTTRAAHGPGPGAGLVPDDDFSALRSLSVVRSLRPLRRGGIDRRRDHILALPGPYALLTVHIALSLGAACLS